MRTRTMVLAAILLMLILAMVFRYSTEAQRAEDINLFRWERDNWTGDVWMYYYTPSRSGVKLVSYSGNYHDSAFEEGMNTRNALTYIWFGINASILTWLLMELRQKSRPNRTSNSKPSNSSDSSWLLRDLDYTGRTVEGDNFVMKDAGHPLASRNKNDVD